MSTGYAIAYRLGITPWERAGREAAGQFTALLSREEAERIPPYGRALDLGCGTGAHSLELAQRGWVVTGIDAVGAAVHQARARAAEQEVDVRFLEGDVTALRRADVGEIGFFLDVGCFHGLTDSQRAAMGDGVTAVAAPGATLLLLAFRPGRRPLLPRGAGRGDVETAFPGWILADEVLADVSGMPGPLRRTVPCWYRLRRA
ncbi:Methyltransferase domain-containing protein [Blastococcus sp. DSM 46786]|uniref:class I SAM-dependent methyltransferase n=1 Tax=Blastococcus sp. DSM 46786 TaxID=1798227 RepID=UPI0008D11E5D|nr:class I SAM-dependent methyltransferase [Blastococcus sp. DSM 46786]SEL12749.1 Methyltransferase domain-containing protein [Blastococcus sp. DSM 46786]